MGIIEWLSETEVGKSILVFMLAMVPVIELRGAIPMGVTFGLPVIDSALLSVVGNMVPVPIIIVFVRKVFDWMRRRNRWMGDLADKFERTAKMRGERFYRGELIGLMIFVAIPLPGTGAWSGALIAAILDLRLKAALPVIGTGVLIAGILVTGITYGFKTLLF